jgi:hypothetical protein
MDGLGSDFKLTRQPSPETEETLGRKSGRTSAPRLPQAGAHKTRLDIGQPGIGQTSPLIASE